MVLHRSGAAIEIFKVVPAAHKKSSGQRIRRPRRPKKNQWYQAGHTIAAALGELGRDGDFGDLATKGRAEAAVVKLLTRDAGAPR